MMATKTWWWVSFCDLNKPAGQQFIGVAIMSNPDERPPWASLVERENVDVYGKEIPRDLGDPPVEWADQLLTDKARIEELTRAWHGDGCTTLAEWEAQQP